MTRADTPERAALLRTVARWILRRRFTGSFSSVKMRVVMAVMLLPELAPSSPSRARAFTGTQATSGSRGSSPWCSR